MKEIKETEKKKIRQIKSKKRDSEAEEEDEERRKGRLLAGPKIERPTLHANAFGAYLADSG